MPDLRYLRVGLSDCEEAAHLQVSGFFFSRGCELEPMIVVITV